MGSKINFGDIIELPLKKFFRREDKDFTLWLRENIDMVGNAIGIEIEEAETEVSIGIL
ncbi:MAG TPA: hypothetical protein PLO64_01930 [Methanothermobacter sp.]|nr:conserved hypothetical protein [Methanothermobacter sp. MT-2]HHW05502.1 hypothetical protein [Methanothermobacter sp.]HOK72603.1 hypothetical protein [Methanothermobacter sp.]HOL68677.1 hypothetical protein [Methanothermobacter sp.]HPQ04436.1 hypothetical protein [Methanothermobacter sp.]